MLSGLTKLALEMARSFQAQAVVALASGDLDRACKTEARFSSLFLAIRRVVALQAKLRRQRREAAASPTFRSASSTDGPTSCAPSRRPGRAGAISALNSTGDLSTMYPVYSVNDLSGCTIRRMSG